MASHETTDDLARAIAHHVLSADAGRVSVGAQDNHRNRHHDSGESVVRITQGRDAMAEPRKDLGEHDASFSDTIRYDDDNRMLRHDRGLME